MAEKIIGMIASHLNKKKEDVKLESKLIEDLGADSLDLIELVMSCEDEFGISLPDEEIAKFKTVGDIVNYLTKASK